MKMLIKEEFFNENDYTFLYNYSSKDEFIKKIDNIMTDRGYQNRGNNLYEKGNKVLRLLFCAFCKHYKMDIIPEFLNDSEVRVAIKKRSSGFAGGIIGMNQIQKKLRALKECFNNL